MPNYVRPDATGAVVFFTVNLADCRKTLLTDHIHILRRAVRETRADAPFVINAWVVLPDHMHAVWTLPAGDRAYGQRWGKIKSKFTRGLRDAHIVSRHELKHAKDTLGHAGIWQPRFWEHHIRSAAEVQETIRYCWGNPVKHAYVADPHDWPFSSIHRDVPRTYVSTASDDAVFRRAGLRPAAIENSGVTLRGTPCGGSKPRPTDGHPPSA